MLERIQEHMLALVAITNVRIVRAESLRFPELRSSTQGYSAPNARPNGVTDGKQADINIPAPPGIKSDAAHGMIRVNGYPLSCYSCREKRAAATVPQTDTGRRVEYTKARE